MSSSASRPAPRRCARQARKADCPLLQESARNGGPATAGLWRLWLIEAVKYDVVPLHDRTFERFNPDLAGRPQLIRGNSQLLFPGMRVSENCVLTLKNKSYSVTANITVPESGAAGVIITQGGIVGGWSLYAHEGRLKYCYNFLGVEHFMVTAGQPIPAGKHQVRMEFAYDGGGLAKGGDVTLYYDGKSVGKGRVEHTQPMIYSADEACDVGADTGSPASPDYGPPATSSPDRSIGCRSTSATTARIT
jgi:hypothetical protein